MHIYVTVDSRHLVVARWRVIVYKLFSFNTVTMVTQVRLCTYTTGTIAIINNGVTIFRDIFFIAHNPPPYVFTKTQNIYKNIKVFYSVSLNKLIRITVIERIYFVRSEI